MKRVRSPGKSSQPSFTVLKSPLTRKVTKKQKEDDYKKLILAFIGIVVVLLILPNLGKSVNGYIRKVTSQCPNEPGDLSKPGTMLYFYPLKSRLQHAAIHPESRKNANAVKCENENNLCGLVQVQEAVCVKECLSLKCGSDMRSWACEFIHDKMNKYELKVSNVACLEQGDLQCAPCWLTYTVEEKSEPCVEGLCVGDTLTIWRRGFYYRIHDLYVLVWENILYILLLIPCLSLLAPAVSLLSPKRTRRRRRITKHKQKKKKKRRRSSSSSSNSKSDLDTDDELDRFFSDSS